MNWKQRGITITGLALFGVFCLAGFCWNNEFALWHIAILTILAALTSWIVTSKEEFVAVTLVPLFFAVITFLVMIDFCEPRVSLPDPIGWLLGATVILNILNIFAIPLYLLIACFSKKLNRYCADLTLIAISAVLLLFSANALGHAGEIQHVAEKTRRYAPLIKAIETFERDKGRPRRNLTELIPKYMTTLPDPSEAIVYRTASEFRQELKDDTTWEIQVPYYYSAVFYWPKKDYSEKFSYPYAYRQFRRVGDWFYLDRD